MQVLKTIRDANFGEDVPSPERYETRGAGRAIVFDADRNIALLHVTKEHYHKLPGGGIEEGEDPIAAMRREVLEEIGCEVENIKELGIIEEYRNKMGLHQTSYCYVADLVGEKGRPHFEEGEIALGFEIEWMTIEDAIKTLESETDVEEWEGKFIVLRDLTFVRAAR
jgi:8-oxo-dGTP diphosphatase